MSGILAIYNSPYLSTPAQESSPRTAESGAFAQQLAKRMEAHSGSSQTVSTTRTPLRGSEAASAISDAWHSLYGTRPSRAQLSVLVAQWSHETGAGRSMMNFNFGGIKGTGPSGLSTRCKTKEGWGESEQTIQDNFRAYRSASEGALDYVRFLQKNYPAALDKAKHGDAEGFVHELKRKGYFTGNEEAYVQSVKSIASKALSEGFDAIANPERSGYPTAPQQGSLGAVDIDNPELLSTVPTLAFADVVGRAAVSILTAGDSSDPNKDY